MQPSDSSPTPNKLLPFLLILFAASGAAGLIYEIVWLQLLQLVIGSSAVSLAVLLGTFMGGMCLGSVFFSRVISTKQNPLRVYALLEVGTAICGVLVLFGLPLIENLYLAGVSSGLPGMLLRALACAVCLLPPTFLMGATLPAISRWVVEHRVRPSGGAIFTAQTLWAACSAALRRASICCASMTWPSPVMLRQA